MKKTLFVVMMALSLFGCNSEEKEAISDAIFNRYKEDAIASDTYVKSGIYNVSIESENKIDDEMTEIEVKFTILEEHPSRNVKYKGNGTILKYSSGYYKVKSYTYY